MKFIHPKLIFLFGVVVVLAGFAELLITGGSSYIPIHDQLDGELFTYILAAKHFLDSGSYLELMNGLPSSGMTMPAPAFVLFFMILPPLGALIAMWIFISLCAYIGMYFVVHKVTKSPLAAMISGGLFAYLPFFPVYGLSIMGIPLVIYALWGLLETPDISKKLRCFALIILYALCSSFVLSGIFVIGMSLLFGIAFAIRRRFHLKAYFFGILTLVICYVCINIPLILQLFDQSERYKTHKSEYVIHYVPIKDTLKELLFGGQLHTQSVQKGLLPLFFSLLILLICFALRKHQVKGSLALPKNIIFPLYVCFTCLILNIFIAVFAALCNSMPIIHIRNSFESVLKYYQFNRLYWLMPSLWYIAFGSAIYSVYYLFVTFIKRHIVSFMITCVFIAVSGAFIILKSTMWINPIDMADPTWNELWETDLWEDVKETIAKDTSEYRVISLGLTPSVALYNGFYCLDAYSNNYPLTYKHEFRKVIAPELEKSAYNKAYFDEWGNRCYGFAAEVSYQHFMDFYPGSEISALDWDMVALKALSNADVYIFSTVTIGNADALGLSYEGYFESKYRRYGIYLYRL